MNPFFEEVKKRNTISAICRRVIENVLTGIPEKNNKSSNLRSIIFARVRKNIVICWNCAGLVSLVVETPINLRVKYTQLAEEFALANYPESRLMGVWFILLSVAQ